jgi:hypothetical protein
VPHRWPCRFAAIFTDDSRELRLHCDGFLAAMKPPPIGTFDSPRRVFVVMSPKALGYAKFALESLLSNCAEPMHLHLITDSQADKAALAEELTLRQTPGEHRWSVFEEEELADHEATTFAGLPNLRRFRHGHPCWRKITDPLLLTRDGEEMVLLDPDLYFPNRFRFEPTPQTGVLLMWQKPNCLVPPETVRSGMRQGIHFAHHVDIGVGGWRAPVDLEWLEWLLTRLGGSALPRAMHVEAIVWAAIAMQIGGGYLDPKYWLCWHRNQTKRFLRRAGVPGRQLLRLEDFTAIKCFHAGGEAKWWLAEGKQMGLLDQDQDLTAPGPILPFEELMPETYDREQRFKNMLARLGYYSLFNT